MVKYQIIGIILKIDSIASIESVVSIYRFYFIL